MPHQERAQEPRLTIELVPQTCWFSNVRSEVSPAEWDRLRKTTAEAAGNKCEVCGGRGPKWPVECHEIWEYDDAARRQTLLGLTVLCPSCHEVKHIGLANVRGRGRSAAKHLAAVNDWAQPQADMYIAEQFAVWEKRSRFEWVLDLSWLGQCGISIRKPRGSSK